MRLRLSIRRHGLPAVQIVFSTGSGPQSSTQSVKATISDFLHDVNDLIPLESEDGSWGLEDYIVEVKASGNQDVHYECLHFQSIQSVLKEDDEVIVRPLSVEETRSRRLGGRDQISGDGRHLVDGIAFGRKWLKKGSRPGVTIPPKKKMRLEHDRHAVDQEPDLVSPLKDLYQSTLPQSHSSMNSPGSEEDTEDEEEDENENENEEIIDSNIPMVIATRSVTRSISRRDDEASSATLEDLPSDEIADLLNDARYDPITGAELASQFITYDPFMSKKDRKRRKRKEKNDTSTGIQDHEFEGFSTPARPNRTENDLAVNITLGDYPVTSSRVSSTRKRPSADFDDEMGQDSDAESYDSMLAAIAMKERLKRATNIIHEDANDLDEDDEDDETYQASTVSNSSRGSDSMMEEIAEKLDSSRVDYVIKNAEIPPDDSSEEDDDYAPSDDDSSSSVSADSMVDEIQQKRKSPLYINSDESSGDDENDSNAALSASSNSSMASDSMMGDIEVKQASRAHIYLSDHSSDDDTTSYVTSESNRPDSETSSDKDEAGEDQDAAHDHDLTDEDHAQQELAPAIALRAKIAAGLGSSGLEGGGLNSKKPLPSQSGLQVLKITQAPHGQGKSRTQKRNKRARRQKRLQHMQSKGIFSTTATFKDLDRYDAEQIESNEAERNESIPLHGDIEAEIDGISGKSPEMQETIETVKHPETRTAEVLESTPEDMPNSEHKRTKLDLAATRRMLFGFLGMKNPKTPALEKDLREKISQSFSSTSNARQHQDEIGQSQLQVATQMSMIIDDEEDWRQRLILSAVECEQQDVILPQPPFPFFVGWSKGKARQDRNSNTQADIPMETPTKSLDPILPQQPSSPKATVPQLTMTLPSVDEIEDLPNLDHTDILPGATIAFKQLEMNADTNYEPKISEYRIGNVQATSEGGGQESEAHILIFDEYMPKQIFRYDPVSGERIYGKFELEDCNESDADGEYQMGPADRMIRFIDLIDAKLVSASKSRRKLAESGSQSRMEENTIIPSQGFHSFLSPHNPYNSRNVTRHANDQMDEDDISI